MLLYLYDSRSDTNLTGQIVALLEDISKQGAGLRISQVFVDGKHIFYAGLGSETTVLKMVFRSTEGNPEAITTLFARSVWFDRDMQDTTDMPFRIGVKFVEPVPKSCLGCFDRRDTG